MDVNVEAILAPNQFTNEQKIKQVVWKIFDAEVAFEGDEREVMIALLNEVEALVNGITDRELADAGLLLIQRFRRKLERRGVDIEAGNANAQEMPFDEIWIWCQKTGEELGIDFDDKIKERIEQALENCC